jgi:hypothetical protein
VFEYVENKNLAEALWGMTLQLQVMVNFHVIEILMISKWFACHGYGII